MAKKKVEIDRILEIYAVLDDFMFRLDRDTLKNKQDMMLLP